MIYDINKKSIINSVLFIKVYVIYTNVYHDINKICDIISSIMIQYNIDSNYEYQRAIGNAMRHGSCPIKCKIYVNDERQCLITIDDSGLGFNYKDIISKYKKGEKYYSYHGSGIKSYSKNKNLLVYWCNNGKRIILYYGKYNNNNILKGKYNIKEIDHYYNNKKCHCSKCKKIAK